MYKIAPLFVLLLWLTSCGGEATLPADYSEAGETARIFPDYRDVTIPPNIAPLNFQVEEEGDAFVAHLSGGGKEITAGADADGKFDFDTLAWRELLEAAKEQDVSVDVYAKRDGNWTRFKAHTLHVATEPIDPFLSYRLIEPSYELFRQLGLYQRDLTTFEQRPIYENNRVNDEDNNHCVNCHNYQNYSTERMLFHVRAMHGGTIVTNGKEAVKLGKDKENNSPSMVYPTWHPTQNWIVFSTNKTGQTFHVVDGEKVEVVDYGSDLLFYDVDANELRPIMQTDDKFETFPCWAPDGQTLYYCCADVPQFAGKPDSVAIDLITKENKHIRYNLVKRTFDPASKTFGPEELVLRCDTMLGGGRAERHVFVDAYGQPTTAGTTGANRPIAAIMNPADTLGLSAAVPRVSPDGKYLLFTLARYGQFHIWHKSADLWVRNLESGETYPLAEANSPDVDSYHTWSSNGRWIVFASRRLDGSYSRAFIAYFDKDGRAHKAFLLPQRDPEENRMLLKSYNVPELTKDRVRLEPDEFKAVIYADDKTKPVQYNRKISENPNQFK